MYSLTFSTLGKIFSRQHFEMHFFFLNFPRKQDLTFHAIETICMKCPVLFFGKNKKNIINLSSAEFAQRVVKVKETSLLWDSVLF